MAEISPELDQLVVSLLQAAMDLVDAGETVPVMLAVDGQEEFETFEDDSPDGCYRAACKQVGDLGAACTRYALLYNGIVQDEGMESGMPALLFEFAERGMENAWSGYVLYRGSVDDGYEYTDPLPAGEETLLFG